MVDLSGLPAILPITHALADRDDKAMTDESSSGGLAFAAQLPSHSRPDAHPRLRSRFAAGETRISNWGKDRSLQDDCGALHN